MVPFLAMHVVPLLAFWTGTRWQDWAVCAGLYFIRMFGVTGVYHRYFSHRTYKMGRGMQFFMALLAMSSSQKGVLWWAAHHRHHHKHSDEISDVHSPKHFGFWHAHCGWLFDDTSATDYRTIKDFAKYPELVFLDKYWYLPPALLGVTVWLLMGWSGLLIGFCLSTALCWHGTYTINSLSHVFGKRRFETTDTSTNNWMLAIITLGEGWHNNHHYFQGCTRQGLFWYEIDVTYYILRALQAVGLVHSIKEPPAAVYEAARAANLAPPAEPGAAEPAAAESAPADLAG